jgi:hypothetical protein
MIYRQRPPNRRRGSNSPPAWIIFLAGIALVFGLYYVWLGVQNFLRSGGRGVVESTAQAEIVATATAQVALPTRGAATPLPTFTPIPTCEDFIVIVPNARVRETPSESGAVIDAYVENDPVCVIGRPSPESEWYTIDQRPGTRRIETAYMHESVIAPVNPTPTPSTTPTPLPTVTATPSPTSTATTPPRPTVTIDLLTPDTATPTLTPTATPPRQNA